MKQKTIIIITVVAVAIAVGVYLFIKKRKGSNSAIQGETESSPNENEKKIEQLQNEIKAINEELSKEGITNETELLDKIKEKEKEIEELLKQ